MTDIEFGGVNQKVLEMAPCSVGLLVDRGLRIHSLSFIDLSFSCNKPNYEQIQIIMIFIGGPDDREALTYAWRMAGHQSVNLTVIQFLEGENVMDSDQFFDYVKWFGGYDDDDILTIDEENQREYQFDDEFLRNFQERIYEDESISFVQMVVNNGEEIISSLKNLDIDVDLYVIGRGQYRFSLLTIGLLEWSECKELGPLGDTLVECDFTSNISLLVMQQYNSVTSSRSIRKVKKKIEDKSSSEEDKVSDTSSSQQP